MSEARLSFDLNGLHIDWRRPTLTQQRGCTTIGG